jgi:hypothetical protein
VLSEAEVAVSDRDVGVFAGLGEADPHVRARDVERAMAAANSSWSTRPESCASWRLPRGPRSRVSV